MGKPTLETLTGKKHISYSGFDTYLQCGEKFRLQRVLNVPEDQAWWFIGGTAFHTATEYWDRGDDRTLINIWHDAWVEATEGLDETKPIKAGGRATKQWPDKENAAWWGFHGPQMLADYVKWRGMSGWEIYTLGDQPFIEWEFLLTLESPILKDNASEFIQVKGFVDRVFVTPEGEAVVVDLKTGSREPASTMQLGVYAAALRHHGGIDPVLGGYYMSRTAKDPNLRALSMYTDQTVAYLLSTFEDSVREEKFIPHVTSMCQTCTVAPFCYAVGGQPPGGLPFEKKKEA